MLQPSAHVPASLAAEVPCDGGRLILALSEPGDRLVMLLSADRPVAVLDAAAVDALLQALGEVAGRMAE